MLKKDTQEIFISKSRAIFGDLFDYSKVDFKNSRTPVILICKIHGDFWSIPKDHICYKRGCLVCSGFKYNKDKFIQEAQKVHGLDAYDYSEVEFINVKVPIKIICKIHGPFMQTPDHHKNRKHGCPKCTTHRPRDIEYVIGRGNIIHNNKYDYSQSVFSKMSETIDIICPIHHLFKQTPDAHIYGKSGCPKCATENSRSKQEDIISRFIQIHGDRYDYSRVIFTIFAEKVEIICKNHGSFWQRPMSHIRGANCPKCIGRTSKMEIHWLDTLFIPQEYRNITLYGNNEHFRVDAFNPITNTIYEFYGDYWHGNPNIYSPDHRNKHNKQLFSELYSKTMIRHDKLLSMGYKIIFIWESDFKKQLKELNNAHL